MPEESDPLQSLIDDILEAENRGDAVGREAFIRQHPEHADSLRKFFANHDSMKGSSFSEDVTIPPSDPSSAVDATQHPSNVSSREEATLAARDSTSFTEATVGDNVRYFGDYELLEEIARGGMGVVYKARQINLNRIVALKMILAGQLAGEEDVKRFYTEAEAAANLDHPGIVPIFEVGQHQGQHYFSMGYIEGQSLAQKVAGGPLPPREAAELVQKICEAMAYAHERGVIHRDLKPANILLDQNGQPKVTDFGLAKQMNVASSLTGTGQILGTPSYMAPEQANGQIDQVGPLADVYAIGAILYCILTGRPPFQAASALETLMQVVNREPPAPRELNPSIPVDLETICLKCLNKTSKNRYTTPAEISQELERFMNGHPILARPVSRRERAWRWCKRNPAIASLLVSATLGIVASVSLAWLANGRAIEAKSNLYASLLSRVQQHINSQENLDARWLLEKCPEDQRDWEWFHLWRQCEAQRRVVDVTAATPENAAPGLYLWRSDSPCFVTGEGVIFDGDSGDKIGEIASWTPMAANRSGRVVAGLDLADPSKVRLVEPLKSETLRWLEGHTSPVSMIHFDPRSTRLTTLAKLDDSWESRRWEGESGELIKSISRDKVKLLSLSPCGGFAADVDEQYLHLWDIETGEQLLQMPAASAIRASAGAQQLFYVSSAGAMYVWNGLEHCRLQYDQDSVAHWGGFYGSGRWLVTLLALKLDPQVSQPPADGSPEYRLIVWNAATGRMHMEFKNCFFAISPSGKYFLSCDNSQMGAAPEITLWDMEQKQPLRSLNFSGYSGTASLSNFAFSESEEFVSAFAQTSTIPNLAKLNSMMNLAFQPQRKFFSNVGTLLKEDDDGPTRQRKWVVWQVANPPLSNAAVANFSDVQFPFRRDQLPLGPQRLSVVGINSQLRAEYEYPDAIPLLGFQGDGKLTIKRGNGTLRTLKNHGLVQHMTMSQDGQLLATARFSDAVSMRSSMLTVGASDWTSGDIELNYEFTVWRVSTGTVVSRFRGHRGAISSMAFNPSGTRLATVDAFYDDSVLPELRDGPFTRGEMIVWSTSSGQPLLKYPSMEPGGFREVCFSLDGKQLAARGQSMVVWDSTQVDLTQRKVVDAMDSATHEKVQTLKWLRENQGTSPAITVTSPASVLQDSGLRLYNTGEGRVQKRLHTPGALPIAIGDVTRIDFDPSGKRIAVGETGGVRVFDASSGEQLEFQQTARSVSDVGFSSQTGDLLYSTSNPLQGKLTELFQCDPASIQPQRLLSVTADSSVFRVFPLQEVVLCGAVETIWFRDLTGSSMASFHLPTSVEQEEQANAIKIMRERNPYLRRLPTNPKTDSVYTDLDMCFAQELMAAGTKAGNIAIWKKTESSNATASLRVIKAHAQAVAKVRFSPDGRWLFSTSSQATEDQHSIKIWEVDATGNTPLRILSGHQGPILDFAVSSDGRYLASASRNDDVRLWDCQTGELVWMREVPAGFKKKLLFSPDVKTLVSCGGNGLVNLDVATGSPILQLDGHLANLRRSVISSDGNQILTRSKYQIRLWDAASGELQWTGMAQGAGDIAIDVDAEQVILRELNQIQFLSMRDGTLVQSAAVDGVDPMCLLPKQRVLFISNWDRYRNPHEFQLTVLNCDSGKVLETERLPVPTGLISPTGRVGAVELVALAATSDERNIAIAFNYSVHWIDTKSRAVTNTWDCPVNHRITAVATIPDEPGVVVATDNGTLHIWNPVSGEVRTLSVGEATNVLHVLVSPSGGMLAASTALETVVWSLADLAVRARIPGRVSGLSFFPDGKQLLMDDKIVTLNLATDLPSIPHVGTATALKFGPDGRYLAVGGEEGTVTLYDRRTKHLVFRLLGHTAPVTNLAFSPDGKFLASAGGDQTIRVWDCTIGLLKNQIRELDWGISAIAFDPHGRTIAASTSHGNVQVFDLASNQSIHSVQLASPVKWLAFTESGEQLIAADLQQVWQWNSATGEVVPCWNAKGHVVGLSSDGSRIAEISRQGALTLSSIFSGARQLLHVEDGLQIRNLSFSENGQWLSYVASERAELWDLDQHRVKARTPADKWSLAEPAADGELMVVSSQIVRKALSKTASP